MLSERLRGDEASLTERAVDVLDRVVWARPVVQRLRDAGGISPENKPLMFEVRVAYELYLARAIAEYEHKTGSGDSSVDFRVQGDPSWLIEVVSLGKTEGMRSATQQYGPLTVLSVGSDPSDPKQTEVGELLTTQGKIAAKARKFCKPVSALHLVLVDTRAYLDHGADMADVRELTYGWRGLPPYLRHILGHVWNGQPVKGLLEEGVPLKDAVAFRERIHFVGFVAERRYREGEIRDRGRYLINHHLFATEQAGVEAFRSCPLRCRSKGS